ncbi:MAG TPA: M55 family metallopeptidase, partial [Chloroflexota bacterium]|nr:M55 family metallopeptidase [Chloroflexota bacterium]
SGLFMREQTWYWEPAVRPEIAAEGKQLLIDDVNSLSAAALAAGADELIVCDTHHGGGNIVLERMLQDPRITYLGRSVGDDGGERRWMPGLDRSVDAFMLPGHHAKAGTPNAFLPHTSSLAWADFRINGQSVGEMGIESCFAAHWDVPLIFAQGDAAGCAEAEEQFAGVVTACVKRARSRDFAEGLDAAEARQLTASKATEAIARARAAKPSPFKPTLPMTVTVQLTTVAEAEKVASRPGVRRVDDLTVEGIAERHCDVLRWLNGTGLNMAPRA